MMWWPLCSTPSLPQVGGCCAVGQGLHAHLSSSPWPRCCNLAQPPFTPARPLLQAPATRRGTAAAWAWPSWRGAVCCCQTGCQPWRRWWCERWSMMCGGGPAAWAHTCATLPRTSAGPLPGHTRQRPWEPRVCGQWVCVLGRWALPPCSLATRHPSCTLPPLPVCAVATLAPALITMACYDREVNCRRAAAAAFQVRTGTGLDGEGLRPACGSGGCYG